MKPYLAREELEYLDIDDEDGEEEYECGDWDEPSDPGTAAFLSFARTSGVDTWQIHGLPLFKLIYILHFLKSIYLIYFGFYGC